jgi:hypothetical protein
VKADKHFVRGIARDPVKLQFLRAIQHIAENSGSQVIAEGIEGAEDFRVAKDIGIACGQGWFIGRPAERPTRAARGRGRLRRHARARGGGAAASRRDRAARQDLIHAVAPVAPARRSRRCCGASSPRPAPPRCRCVRESASRACSRAPRSSSWPRAPTARACSSVPASRWLERRRSRSRRAWTLSALTALLVESDPRHVADGFVIVSQGRYLGMGRTADVMRALQSSRVLAARYTNPLTMLPGQVPINEHLERLLAGARPSPRGSSRSTRCAA